MEGSIKASNDAIGLFERFYKSSIGCSIRVPPGADKRFTGCGVDFILGLCVCVFFFFVGGGGGGGVLFSR